MVNAIKDSGGGLALQVTTEARDAGLVEENTDGDATRLADVYVYGFEKLLLVIDLDRVTAKHRSELVAVAARDTDSIYHGARASVKIAGHGYQVQLPGCRAAGFHIDDQAPVSSLPGVLVIHDESNTRLAEDLRTIRYDQTQA
jgi:hypothetical protein